jgi:hypothetical protein
MGGGRGEGCKNEAQNVNITYNMYSIERQRLARLANEIMTGYPQSQPSEIVWQ